MDHVGEPGSAAVPQPQPASSSSTRAAPLLPPTVDIPVLPALDFTGVRARANWETDRAPARFEFFRGGGCVNLESLVDARSKHRSGQPEGLSGLLPATGVRFQCASSSVRFLRFPSWRFDCTHKPHLRSLARLAGARCAVGRLQEGDDRL